jgi:hypothetical protein
VSPLDTILTPNPAYQNWSNKRVKPIKMPFLIGKSEKSSFYEKIVKLIILKRSILKLPSINTDRKEFSPFLNCSHALGKAYAHINVTSYRTLVAQILRRSGLKWEIWMLLLSEQSTESLLNASSLFQASHLV